MAKAGRVPGIKPGGSLRRNARRVVETRLAELLSWSPALHDETLVDALHDMRIAAKRLRYALEMFTVCFETRSLLKDLTAIQEDLGDIHDLDVLAGLLRERLMTAQTALEDRAVAIMAQDQPMEQRMQELQSDLNTPDAMTRRLGLLALVGEKVAERHRRYQQFTERWAGEELQGFADRVRAAAAANPTDQTTGEQRDL